MARGVALQERVRHTIGAPAPVDLVDAPRSADADLGRRLSAEDPTVITDLYAVYAGRILAVALRIVGDRGSAEDVVQETFLRAWRRSADFDPTRELEPWLFRIAQNAALDVVRTRNRRPRSGLADPELALRRVVDRHREHCPERSVHDSWEVWRVRAAIDQLPDIERDVVRLQHLDGFTHREIAGRLGVSLGTVKSRSHRAYRRLADALID
ncbi:MAG: sigma-70 family RNA polymerase sigma factor [Actinomycetota bacterium]